MVFRVLLRRRGREKEKEEEEEEDYDVSCAIKKKKTLWCFVCHDTKLRGVITRKTTVCAIDMINWNDMI